MSATHQCENSYYLNQYEKYQSEPDHTNFEELQDSAIDKAIEILKGEVDDYELEYALGSVVDTYALSLEDSDITIREVLESYNSLPTQVILDLVNASIEAACEMVVDKHISEVFEYGVKKYHYDRIGSALGTDNMS